MNKVYKIWTVLESGRKGFYKRLYSSEPKHNLYCIYEASDTSYGIALSYPNTISLSVKPFEKLSELKVNIFEDASFKDCNMLIARISKPEDKEPFSYMCENVIHNIIREESISSAVKTFVNTLFHWQKLFDQKKSQGLSKEEQTGLYGELVFLQKMFLKSQKPKFDILQYYVGVNKALRDFQGSDWAVEVKTTSKNNPQSLTINGERQLDDTIIDYLYLFHCSVEVSKLSGETLSEKIEAIRTTISNDLTALSLFNSKLFEAGWFSEHNQMYNERHYKIRSVSFYSVTGDFPRIIEKDLRRGVGNIQYNIVLTDCSPYLVSEDTVITHINND